MTMWSLPWKCTKAQPTNHVGQSTKSFAKELKNVNLIFFLDHAIHEIDECQFIQGKLKFS